ncbi:hypothetical protein AALO_G00196740 [Alosa alosa]|uniref:CCHC-type domain-containing protein n=1 Tax=Alosa alosa TaxID=278164 RepID=A0AAV6G1H5_9TELE|nr:hypothetical protein AALO_G00196740 [Alosa alosa]
MEADLQQLRDLVTQLQAENERLKQAQPPDDVLGPDVDPEPAPGASERFVYVPRERRCPMFRGKSGMSIGEWIEEVQASMRIRHMTPVEKAYFIFDHLEGEAKDEIKYRPKADREDPTKILAILQELYGCAESYVALQKDFFSRRQLEGESLQEYSHALFELMDRVTEAAPHAVPNSDILLRDQFVEHVNDPDLRRALKQVVRTKPDATLLYVRGEAIRWEREGRPAEGRSRSFSVPSICATQTLNFPRESGAMPKQSELYEVKTMLKKQQEQLDKLSHSVSLLQNPRRPQSITQGPIICRRCEQPGHYARNCDNVRVTHTVNSQSQEVGGENVQRQVSEN